ncbi:hypothetical protein NX059_006632 [Plenodomus lindquistii]|nr:hypothetical protein NX059_006632 [Plenodomus lindquistii]
MDEGDATGADDDGLDEEGDAAGIRDDATVNRVVDAVGFLELAEVGFTDTTDTFVDDVDVFFDVEEAFTDVETDKVQSPKPFWQPVPQYAADAPHQPLVEQQFPNAESLQVRVFDDCVPQRPVVLRVRASAPRNGRAAMANSKAECIMNKD